MDWCSLDGNAEELRRANIRSAQAEMDVMCAKGYRDLELVAVLLFQ